MEEHALPSAKHPELTLIESWLNAVESCNGESPSYCHLLIKQRDEVDASVWDELFAYIDHAHEGARQNLRAPLENTLHPLHHGTKIDPACGYPHRFYRNPEKCLR